MRAARFHKAGRPLAVEEIPCPEPGPQEVLFKVRACGICGSDIHIVYEGITPTAFQPITLGEGVKGWKVGDRAAVNCIVSCGQCPNCRSGNEQICLQRKLLGIHMNGGLAEYAAVPEANLARLPAEVPFDQGAILTDAVATPYHALTRRGRLSAGEAVAVFGCGGLGLHGVQLAKLLGADAVIALDTSEVALERAKERGADVVCRPDQEDPLEVVKKATGGRGVDLSLECIGLQETIDLAVRSLKIGGRAVIAGLGPQPISTLPPTEFVRRELTMMGSYAFTTREIEELIQLVRKGKLDLSASISKRIPLEEINQGLEALHKKTHHPIRIVVMM
jgi:threonine dehydrogenase-like Zn-dependent dehydrogenase